MKEEERNKVAMSHTPPPQKSKMAEVADPAVCSLQEIHFSFKDIKSLKEQQQQQRCIMQTATIRELEWLY